MTSAAILQRPTRALSVTRPWPELIFRAKPIENRTWDTKFRGQFLLHAAQSWAKDAIPFAAMADPDALVGMPVFKTDHPTGIVGVAELTDVCSAEITGEGWPCQCGPWAMAGQRHWKLTNVRRLPTPVPCRGALGLWTPPDDVVAAVEAQYADIEVTW